LTLSRPQPLHLILPPIYSSSASPPASSTLLPLLLPLSFFFTDTPTPQIYTLSLHDALPISSAGARHPLELYAFVNQVEGLEHTRSEEHTSELQSRFDLVCRLLLEKKKTIRHPGVQAATTCAPLHR